MDGRGRYLKMTNLRSASGQTWLRRGLLLLMTVWILLVHSKAEAGYFELAAGFSFERRGYSSEAYEWTRRWSLSAGYYFSETSEIEASFRDEYNRNYIPDYENTAFHNQVFSLNWVQGFLPRTFPVQPYVRGGIGQLYREGTGTFANGTVPTQLVASLTVVFGAGVKVQIIRGVSIRIEGLSYVPTSNIERWKDNFNIETGFALYY